MDFWDHKHWRDIHQNDPYANVPKVMTPHLVKHVLPNIKLILLLREPAERYFFIRFLLVLSIFTFKFSKIYLSTQIWLGATGQVWVEGQDSYQIFLTSNLKSEQTITIGVKKGGCYWNTDMKYTGPLFPTCTCIYAIRTFEQQVHSESNTTYRQLS